MSERASEPEGTAVSPMRSLRSIGETGTTESDRLAAPLLAIPSYASIPGRRP